MNVLITGGGGFIGSHLVESQLMRGHKVRTVDLHKERLAHLVPHPNLEVVLGDITDPVLGNELLNGVEVVYHLASAHLDVTLSDERYWLVNVGATQTLLEAARAANVQRFVHCSSVGVIGDVKNPPADETSPCRPMNVYDKTKLAGERAALQFATEKRLPLVVVRPAWVYGPRCPRTEKLFRAVRTGRFVIFGRGHTLRHPVYVLDAIQGLELCAEKDAAMTQTYIIAGEKAVSINTLVQAVAEVLEVRQHVPHLPASIGRASAFVLDTVFKPLRRSPPFSARSLDFFLRQNSYDISKARDELGFRPQTDLTAGLEQTRRWLCDGTFDKA